MKRLVAFPTEDNRTIVVEVDEEPTAGTVRAARPGEVAETARQTFEAALGPVQTVAEAFVAKLRELSEQPNEVGVEFGIKFSAEAGAIIASTGGEASFKVTLTWARAT